MSGLEGAGLALGVLGIVIAFKGALDSALLIESFVDDRHEGAGYLALNYHIEKTRLRLWGELCRIDHDSQMERCTLREKPQHLKELVVRILGEIEKLNNEANALVTKYQIELPVLPRLDVDDNLGANRALPHALSRLSVEPRSRFRWVIKGKSEFEGVVSKLHKLTGDLFDLGFHGGGRGLPMAALPSQVLASIDSPPFLEILENNPENQAGLALSLSARAKGLQMGQATGAFKSASRVTGEQLTFVGGSEVIGLFRHPRGGKVPVWVEWAALEPGPEYYKFHRMISSLGHMLERVSDPALRLPPCYGVYDDGSHQSADGKKRLGFVFGIPVTPKPQYESNLHRHPPRTLSDIIRDRRMPVPLLEDRFELAYVLATSFSRFHGAGWLHKGFHSNSILFLQRDGGSISATDPFITGFQYSRPTEATSQPYGPLDIKSLEHYYHPDVHLGFSKQRDLYGLGVVLWEIGRWGLVADSVSDSRKRALINRAAWRDYMVNSAAQDMGWRMGSAYLGVVKTLLECRLPGEDEADDEFLAQQYLDKVLQPLSACRV